MGEGRAAGRMGDLLGQFNVATFKTSELELFPVVVAVEGEGG